MKRQTIKRVINVDIIEFEDGSTVDASDIYSFLEEAYEFEDTIEAEVNWTTKYLFFGNEYKKKLEPILLKFDVIRKSPHYKIHNKRVEEGDKTYKYYRYWLSKGYKKFHDDYWNTYKWKIK